MYERKIPKDLDCGMAMTMDIIGNKWKPCLLYSIYKGINRPGQLQQQNPKASRQVLNQQLKELEAHGIIRKVVYAQLPPKVEYFLTELGETLIPVLEAMTAWGNSFIVKEEVFPAVEEEILPIVEQEILPIVKEEILPVRP
ncbi:helix-turn-helix domain-containing protein [Chitinophaga sp. LS1]|uniref:winged helix-turn-helix transcriptional regulator n=1 Tax=Chitinophaga sp. LS1 TaxID=3051176 RepID=UPI002AAAAEE1|nr:helix-turn-helix domain-containing protein [Chitinophaga sp. LS1]WPV67980.1 helix-turn-helix domain-containing protein [Chitinophaga sp. LS1]